MRRHNLHIAVALITFAASTLLVRTFSDLALALPVALAVFIFVKVIPDLEIDPHYLKVVTITLVLWVAVAYVLISIFLPFAPTGGCVVEFSAEDGEPKEEAGQNGHKSYTAEDGTNELIGITAYSCHGVAYTMKNLNTVWAGMVDRKASAKPIPAYPPLAISEGVKGTVAVSVVIDESGKVVWVQSLSGNPMLRQAAMEAACRARFAPTLVNGPPIRVSGILTYRFSPAID